jgi:hypothetical protein
MNRPVGADPLDALDPTPGTVPSRWLLLAAALEAIQQSL